MEIRPLSWLLRRGGCPGAVFEVPGEARRPEPQGLLPAGLGGSIEFIGGALSCPELRLGLGKGNLGLLA
ncbi:hypothetical protein [Paracoccus chinensis]|uniref:hypothetical protein n=1 Tax=Paracoccus chinensis TaxID=525640 RepID=UPI0015880148|nr:hypothetical protein [Paracoccus chinensis]